MPAAGAAGPPTRQVGNRPAISPLLQTTRQRVGGELVLRPPGPDPSRTSQRDHRCLPNLRIGSRWRRLTCGRQALLVLAHLRCGDTYAPLAAGFRIGIATAYRYIREAVDRSPGRPRAHVGAGHDVPTEEGVCDPRRHRAADRPHRRRPAVLLREEEASRDERAGHRRSRRTPDLGLGRTAGSHARPDRGAGPRHSPPPSPQTTSSAGPTRRIRAPALRSLSIRGKHLRGWRRRHNRDHTKIRSLGERAMAILKSWRLLRKLRCSTTRITAVVRAVVALELAS